MSNRWLGFAALMFFGGGLGLAVASEGGLVAGLIGVIPATIIGGALGMLTPLLWFRVFPALAKRDALMSTVERKSGEKI